ncbi:MAG: undecaprenyl-phosphate glucose phosphotransferase [Lachnospiraceae bacterium]
MIKNHQKNLNRLHVIIDMLIVAASYALAYPLRFGFLSHFELFKVEGAYLSFEQYMEYLWLILPGYFLIYAASGLYRSQRDKGSLFTVFNITKANAFGFLYILAILFWLKEVNVSRKFLGVFVVLNFTADIVFRVLLRRILRSIRTRGFNLKHVLIVGYSRTAEGYIDRLLANPHWGYHVKGILDDSMETGTKYKGIPVIGTLGKLPEYLETMTLDEIVITMKIEDYANLGEIVSICEKSGVHTKFVPDYQNVIPTIPYMEDLDGLPVIHIRKVPLASLPNRIMKRAMDLVLGTLALLIAVIPMGIVALLIKLTSPGPVFYAQKRVGLHNREFMMYKFRSMEVQAEAAEKTAWTTFRDPRVTPIGKFIRKTSIDELPQLWNVLKGDMSLVGPRPERPFYVEKFKEEIPRYMIKHQVRPGMTGWAQVNGYRGDTSIRKRIDYDLYYIENWNPGFDILILFLTVFKGFINKNAY